MLPENYNEAYHLAGDGVVVPVVRILGECQDFRVEAGLIVIPT